MYNMRKKNRQTSQQQAVEIFNECTYAVIATVNDDNTPYCIPISPSVIYNDYIYFHCAKSGQKLDNIKSNPKVCITCVGNICIPQNKFTVNFESCVVYGTASIVNDSEEKILALRLICQKYTPENMGNFDEAISKSLDITEICKISVDYITGKSKK